MNKNETKRLVSLAGIRPLVQYVFLFLFLAIVYFLHYPLNEILPNNIFFNFDPLIVLGLVLSGGAVLSVLFFSVINVIVTALFGRVFCGWVCPLGTLFDISAHIIPLRKKRSPTGNGRYKNIKYYLLAFLLAGSLFGFSAAFFFDPLVLIYRTFAMNIYPFIVLILNFMLNAIRPLALKAEMMNLYMFSLEQPVFNALAFINLAMVFLVFSLVYVERRFWCRNLCPLGALLSLIGRFAPWGRRVSDTCISCSKCARQCPMNAIGEDFHDTAPRECIQCLRCQPICPTNAIDFTFGNPSDQRFTINPSRRSIITASVGGVLTALSAGTAGAVKVRDGVLLRPPGSIAEKDFLDTCLRCGECMKVCPTNALQPAKLEAGIEGLFTPVLTPRVGGCEEQCNLCGTICPTGAIRKLPLEEKQFAVIGNATIERNLCIAWEQLKVCLICDEVCPFDAVEFRMVTDEKGTLQRPFVIEDKCVGCGQCEFGCPVNGPAAIHVTPINETRKNSGSYITDEKKKLREVNDEGVDFYGEHDEEPAPAEDRQLQPWEQQGGSGEDLPPGFVE